MVSSSLKSRIANEGTKYVIIFPSKEIEINNRRFYLRKAFAKSQGQFGGSYGVGVMTYKEAIKACKDEYKSLGHEVHVKTFGKGNWQEITGVYSAIPFWSKDWKPSKYPSSVRK